MTTAAEIQARVDNIATNLDRLDGVVNGPASGAGSTTTVDGGVEVKSLARLAAEGQVEVDDATAQRVAAEAAAVDAAAAAAFAEEFSGPSYADTAAGVAATTVGQFFRVPVGTTPETYTRYERISGSPYYREAAGLATTVELANPTGTVLAGLHKVALSPEDTPRNQTGFWWTSIPQSYNGRVSMSVCGQGHALYFNTWQAQYEGGPWWEQRQKHGYVGGATSSDDHDAGSQIKREGKPIIHIYGGHNFDPVIKYRISLKNLEDYASSEDYTWGPEQTYALPSRCKKTSYIIVLPWDGDDHVRFKHRTGADANIWSLTIMEDWATGAISTVDVYESLGQYYTNGRVVGDKAKFIHSDHPIAPLNVNNTVCYSELHFLTGDITDSDGNVLGNIDGTNLPLQHETDLEVIYTSTAATDWRPWGHDVGVGATADALICDGRPAPNTAATLSYKYLRKVGGVWQVTDLGLFGDWNGAFFPSGVSDPDDADAVYINRIVAGISRIERHVTADGGLTFTPEVIASRPLSEGFLCRMYAVRQIGAVPPPFKLLATVIHDYPAYDGAWDCEVFPIYSEAPIKRRPDVDLTVPEVPLTTSLYLPGTSGVYIAAPNPGLGDLVNGIRFETWAALEDWTPAVAMALLAAYDSYTNRGFYFFIGTDGKPNINYSMNGTAGFGITCNVLPPMENGMFRQDAVDFIPVFNSTQLQATFYYRYRDDERWTMLDRIRVVPQAANIGAPEFPAPLHNAVGLYEVGSRVTGTVERAKGLIRRARVMSVGQEIIAEWTADERGALQQTVDRFGKVWTLNKPPQTYGKDYDDSTLLELEGYKFTIGSNGELRVGNDAVAAGMGWTPHSRPGRASPHTSNAVGAVREDFVELAPASASISYTLPSTAAMNSLGIKSLARELVCLTSPGGTIVPNTDQTINGATTPITVAQWDLWFIRWVGSSTVGKWVVRRAVA